MTASAGTTSTRVPAVVLVHGWAGSAAAWDSVLEHWSGRWPVLTVALPGSPGSSSDLPRTIPGATAAVRQVLDEHGGPAVVVGHSMGGQISLHLNVENERVVGEVVIDPAYGASSRSAAGSADWADRIEAVGHDAVRSFFDEAMGVNLPADVGRQMLSDIASTDPATIASYLRSEYLGPGAIGPVDRAAALVRRRRSPVLALYSSEQAARFERAHAAATTTVEIWPGAGHYLHLEDPSRFCRRLETWMAALPTTEEVVASGA